MKSVLEKFVGYFVSGGLAAVVDAGGFALLQANAVAVIPAAVISFCAAAVLNYQLSSRYVFKQQPTQKQFVHFFLVALIGLAVNVSITYYLLTTFELLPVIAKIIAIGFAFFINFLLNYLLVFKASN